MIKKLFAVLLLFGFIAPVFSSDCVILLHGLGRQPGSMARMAEALDRAGYAVWNQGYDSTSADIQTLAKQALEPGLDYCGGYDRTHFVTHSLGGILVRVYLQDRSYDGRIVMLSPPNHGSEIPDVLAEVALIKKMLGPALSQLRTDDQGLPATLDPIQGQIGIITGNRSSDPWFSWLIPGADDGKVSVTSARLEEMTDFLIVPSGHTFIMMNAKVIEQVRVFLEKGRFYRG